MKYYWVRATPVDGPSTRGFVHPARGWAVVVVCCGGVSETQLALHVLACLLWFLGFL